MNCQKVLLVFVVTFFSLLTNAEARYYDPVEGRFISKDPAGFSGGDVNLYAYVQNNPINLTDPYGLCVEDACIGEGIAIGIAACLENPACVNAIRAGAAATGAAIGAALCKDNVDEKKCEENLARDLATCSAMGKRDGKSAYAICARQAYARYSRCLQGGGITPPLPPWGTK